MMDITVAPIVDTEEGAGALAVVSAESAERLEQEAELARMARNARAALLRARRSGGGAEAVAAAARQVDEALAARELVDCERMAWPEGEGGLGRGVARADMVLRLLEENPSYLEPPAELGKAARYIAALTASTGRLWADADGRAGMLGRMRALGLNEHILDEAPTEEEQRGAAKVARERGYQGLPGMVSLPPMDAVYSEGIREVANLLGSVRKSTKGDSLGVEEGFLHTSREGVTCWWDPPLGAVDGRGRPAKRWEQAMEQLARVPEHERARMEARQNLKGDRCRRTKQLVDVDHGSALAPPDDCASMWQSQESLDGGLAELRASQEAVLGEQYAYHTMASRNDMLNLVEGVLRMFGTSLRVMTARGVPEEVVAAVLLFLASPGSKVVMNRCWHRVRGNGLHDVVMPDEAEATMDMRYSRGGSYSRSTIENAKAALSYWCVALVRAAFRWVLSAVRRFKRYSLPNPMTHNPYLELVIGRIMRSGPRRVRCSACAFGG